MITDALSGQFDLLYAAARSRRMRSEGDPASAVISRSFVTLSKAVSTL